MATDSVGARVRQCREAVGISQEGLARRLDVSKNTVSRWERDLGDPSFHLLRWAGDELGVDVIGWVVSGVGDMVARLAPKVAPVELPESATAQPSDACASCAGLPDQLDAAITALVPHLGEELAFHVVNNAMSKGDGGPTSTDVRTAFVETLQALQSMRMAEVPYMDEERIGRLATLAAVSIEAAQLPGAA